jgi:hypothetical protein
MFLMGLLVGALFRDQILQLLNQILQGVQPPEAPPQGVGDGSPF